jgi:TRAP-type C4-dicarboxylate transport system substrate-binding protein
MRLAKHGIDLFTVVGIPAFALSLVLTPNTARAVEAKIYVMKLGTATINESQHEWCKRFTAMVEKDSGGRIKGEIYPASQLGAIPREIEGVQFGQIQGYIGPPEFLAALTNAMRCCQPPVLSPTWPMQSAS